MWYWIPALLALKIADLISSNIDEISEIGEKSRLFSSNSNNTVPFQSSTVCRRHSNGP